MTNPSTNLSAEQRLRQKLQEETYRQRGIGEGFQSGLAFHQYADKNNLGAPLARSAPGSKLIIVAGRQYGYQPFAHDTVYSDSTNWSVVLSMNDLLKGKIPGAGLGQELLEASYFDSGAILRDGWASHQFAVEQKLGPALAYSSNITVKNVQYDIQVFACDTLYAPSSQPKPVLRLSQLSPNDPLHAELWKATCAACGVTYDPAKPLLQAAMATTGFRDVGAPLSNAYVATLEGTPYEIHVFACDTLYRTPGSTNIMRLSKLQQPNFAVIPVQTRVPPPMTIPPNPKSAMVKTAVAKTVVANPTLPNASKVVQAALSCEGKPYKTGSAGPNAFDCSGLVVWSYGQVGNTKLAHKASVLHSSCPRVERPDIQAGDLIFFAEPPGSNQITHVGIYAGNGAMVHASQPGRPVEVVEDVFNASWYKERVAGIGRVKG